MDRINAVLPAIIIEKQGEIDIFGSYRAAEGYFFLNFFGSDHHGFNDWPLAPKEYLRDHRHWLFGLLRKTNQINGSNI